MTRMWMQPPQTMCRKHLLGEHVECHMVKGSLDRWRSVAGHIAKGQLEPQNLQARHDELAREMVRRGYRHNSPLVHSGGPVGHVDVDKSRRDLLSRCAECRGME